MSDAPASRLVTSFRDARETFDTLRSPQVETNAVFAVGFLIGAGLPGSAAAVTLLFEYAFPDYQPPWADPRPEAS